MDSSKTLSSQTIAPTTLKLVMLQGPLGALGTPWSVDRWGRLLAGAGTITFVALGTLVHPLFHIATALIGLNLFVTSLSNSCGLQRTLTKLGAKEREELFAPGGEVRAEIAGLVQPNPPAPR